jgi:DNA mismatch endonuclease (patch repair protein)
MSRIRGKGNQRTEGVVVHLFRLEKITGWRRHLDLPGKPDFTFRKRRLVVFVDGCFWHGCPKCYRAPQVNKKFWEAKVAYNRQHDREVNQELKRTGWKVLRIWQHSLKKKDRARLVVRLRNALR